MLKIKVEALLRLLFFVNHEISHQHYFYVLQTFESYIFLLTIRTVAFPRGLP